MNIPDKTKVLEALKSIHILVAEKGGPTIDDYNTLADAVRALAKQVVAAHERMVAEADWCPFCENHGGSSHPDSCIVNYARAIEEARHADSHE